MTSGKSKPSSAKKLRLIALGSATFLAGFLLFQTIRPKQSPEREQTLRTSPTSSVVPKPPPLESDTATDEHRSEEDQLPPEGAIAEEAILVFESESAFQNFLNTNNGRFSILAENSTLRSVRLRTRDFSQLNNLGADLDFNYTLLTPLPVVIPEGELGPAFENNALDFVRAPQDNKTAGEGVTIAVLDTGVKPHSTLEGTQIESYDLSEDASPSDYASHGTAVASLITGQNGNGIAPAASLISIRVLDTEGIGDTFSLAEGIVQAVDYATSKGEVLVASAGNESITTLPYPAAYDSVIAVGAIDANGHPSYFSNQSDSVDVSAPGVGVYAAWNDEDWISFTGTSASAPYVSGAIATLSSGLDISPSVASVLLLENANDTGLPGVDPQTGNGYIDIQRSLDSNTDYTDIAMADIYLNPTPTEHGQYTVHLTAQNRGTEKIPATSIEYTLPNGVPQTIYLGSLEPGQSASHPITLTEIELSSGQGYQIQATAKTGNQKSDTVPVNDQKSITLELGLPQP